MKDKDKAYFTKLILSVIILVSFLTILGLTTYLVKNKRIVNREPQVSILPKPTDTPVVKDEISDWKTYDNNQYDYSFKYPQTTLLNSYNEVGDEIEITNNSATVAVQYSNKKGGIFSVWHLGLSVLTSDSIKNQFGATNKENISVVPAKVAGEDGYHVVFKDTKNIVSDFYFIKKDEQILKLTVLKGDTNANKIFSTFKFTGKDETADWQTYENNTYGFKIKYPQNFYTQEGKYENEKYRQYWIEAADSKWKDQLVHNPSLIVDVIKTDLKPKEYLNITGSSKSILDDANPCPANITYCSLKYLEFIGIGADQVPALQFYSAAVSGSDYHTIVRIGDFLIDIRAHSSGNGDFSEDTYNKIISTFKYAEKDETADWKTYKNDKYGFEIKYPNIYKFTAPPDEFVEYQKSRGITYLAYLFRTDANASISIWSTNINFNLQDIKQRFAPTGNESFPEQVTAGQNTFYFYGAGGGGVSYPDYYFYNLNGKILIVAFDGPYINDKTPSQEIKQLEPQILSTFKFLN